MLPQASESGHCLWRPAESTQKRTPQHMRRTRVVSRRRFFVIIFFQLLLLHLSTCTGEGIGSVAASEPKELYIVHLSGLFPPAAAYTGGIPGFPATAPRARLRVTPSGRRVRVGRPRLDSLAPHVQAYTAHLRQLHRETLLGAGGLLSDLVYSYDTVLNGFAARLTPSIVLRLQRHHLVAQVLPSRSVQPLLTRVPGFLDIAAGMWSRVKGPKRAGAGVIIGVIDSGIWPENPFFNDSDYGFAPKPLRFRGHCNTTKDFPQTACNKKVIGAAYFIDGAKAETGGGFNYQGDYISARDTYGHGTWVAGAAVGSQVSDVNRGGNHLGNASGMAPRAFLSVYKIFWHKGSLADGSATYSAADADVNAAVERAVKDGVDILSCSYGSTTTDYFSTFQYMYLNAAKAGVLTVMAAGNYGAPEASGFPTVLNVAPWVLSVGYSTIDRSFHSVFSYNGVNITVPTFCTMRGTLGSPLVLASSCTLPNSTSADASFCFPGTLDPAKCGGSIVVCNRGGLAVIGKVAEVQAIGAAGMVMVNVAGGSNSQSWYSEDLPFAHLLYDDGQALLNYMQGTANPTGSIYFPIASLDQEAPQLAAQNFPSSRGPLVNPSFTANFSQYALTNDVLKPDVIGPGSLLVGPIPGASLTATTAVYDFYSGTSMATPILAGIAALVMQKKPLWSVSQIMSAIMTTAYTTTNRGNAITDDFNSTVTPWGIGSGHVNCSAVLDPGLTYNIRNNDYIRFLYGRQPGNASLTYKKLLGTFKSLPGYQLNKPNIVVSFLQTSSITVSRRVTNVGSGIGKYTARVVSPSNAKVTVSPATLALLPGGSRRFHVTFEVLSRSSNFSFGSLVWEDGKGHEVRSVLALQAI